MSLVRKEYTDPTGRKWLMLVPPEENDTARGILAGPPDTSELRLPEDVDLSLNNQLFNRGLITMEDVRRRPVELTAALQAALRIDVNRLIQLYSEVRNVPEP